MMPSVSRLNQLAGEIAQLMRVPQSLQETAANRIQTAIETILYRQENGPLSTNQSVINQIGKVAQRLLGEIKKLNPAGRVFLSYQLDQAEGDAALRRYELLTSTIVCGVSSIEWEKRPRNRPRGSVNEEHKCLKSLIFDLQSIARTSSGKITLGFNMGTRKSNGTLPAILKLLHQHVPALVPANVSYHTLQRMRAEAVNAA